MEKLRAWCEDQLESGRTETNGMLGQAMSCLLRHYERLTLFLREPGAPIDNNVIERLLELVVRGRKNSSCCRSEVGAGVADVISSVLATCHENAIGAFDYRCALRRHVEAVRREPERWLSWNWPHDAASGSTGAATSKT